MNTFARTLAGLALLACAGTASADEFRFVCNSNPGTPNCNPRNAATSTAIAIQVASNMGAQVGDSVMLLKNNLNGIYATQITRYFTVVSTPVDAASDLIVSDYESDTYDGALPSIPLLRAESGDIWTIFLPIPGFVVHCCGQ